MARRLLQGLGPGLTDPSSFPNQYFYDWCLWFCSKYTSWALVCQIRPLPRAFQTGENLTLRAWLLVLPGGPSPPIPIPSSWP